jgi:hypothetical protein
VERERGHDEVSEDRFTVWPIALACCFPAILIILWAGPFNPASLGVPVLFMTWACSASLALGIAIVSASVRDWRRAVSMSVLPLATLIVIARTGTIRPFAVEIGERIHFQAMRGSYLENVSTLSSSGEPGLPYGNGEDLQSGMPLSTTRAMKSHCRSNRQLGRRRLRIPRSDRVVRWGASLGNHFYLVRTGC